MRITYRLALDDYYDAFQTRNAKDRKIRLGAVLAMVLLLLGAWMQTGNIRAGHAYLLLAALLLLSLPLARWLGRRSFESAHKRGAAKGSENEFNVDISEEGIEKDTWSQFSKYSESKNAFILYQVDSIHAILPKRAFDINDLDRFRRLLNANLVRY